MTNFVAVVCVVSVVATTATGNTAPSAGERAFQRCYACHSVVAGEDKLIGPNLRGVVGRKAGTLQGFAFSPAMVAAGKRGLVWTRATLETYLADPEGFVPGTTMAMPPLRDARERKDVIDYLEAHAR